MSKTWCVHLQQFTTCEDCPQEDPLTTIMKRLDTVDKIQSQVETIKENTEKITGEVDQMHLDIAGIIDARKEDKTAINKLEKNIMDVSNNMNVKLGGIGKI